MEELVTKTCYILFGSNPFFVTSVYFLFLLVIYFISKKLKNKEPFLFIVSILPLIIWAVRLILNDYFLSDDFEHFVLISKYSYWEIFLRGITANGVWAFHRLFTGFWLFKLIYSVFFTNYYAYVIVNLIIHVVNAYLFSKILKKVTNNIYIVSISIFLFSSFYLTWISNIHELLAGFFLLLTFNLLLNSKFLFLSIISYILGIYSKEIIFLFPVCYFLFLVFYNNYIKKIDLAKSMKKLTPFFIIFLIYLGVFINDFIKFSNYAEGSGYDLVVNSKNILNHLAFYVDDRIPIFAGLAGLIIFSLIILLFDLIHKKLILIPLYFSYIILLVPVLFLNKNTSYYNYVPFVFLVIIITVLTNKFKYLNFPFSLILTAIMLVYIFKTNIKLQENCFLIQYSRTSSRREAVEDIVNNRTNTSDEAKWFLENNYLPYFINK